MKKTIPEFLKSSRRTLAATVVAVSTSGLCNSLALAQDKWVGTWASAQQGVNVAFGGVAPVFNDQTLRQIVQVSIGGSTVRIRLSNVMGSQPLTVNAASVAKRTSGAIIADDTLRTLSFSGSESVVIPEGAFVLSDPVSLDVQAFDDLAISIYLASETTVDTQHSAALQTNYVSTTGDQTSATELSIESMNESWFLLSGVDVIAPSDTKVIATIGDSITDGTASTADTNNRYPSLLARRLATADGNVAVLNLGIAGNRVLHSVIGPNILSRFDRDVIARSGVTHIVLLEGINDIGLPGLLGLPEQDVTAEQIIGGYKQLILRAHAAGIKIIGSTLTPFKAFLYYTEEGDEKRLAVNEWVRTSGAFDGYVDFDEALRDPENPLQFLSIYDSGDNLHPSDAGYQAMADAIDLSLFGISTENDDGGVSASRYDDHQGEIFWDTGTYNSFNVYRDQSLQTPLTIDASSFYQNSLQSGVVYLYEVIAVDSEGREIEVIGTASMPVESGANASATVEGQRYDGRQAEIFWKKQGFSRFTVYRDGVLVTPDGSVGSSFYDGDLVAGQSYVYQVNGIDSLDNENLIGEVRIPGTAGLAEPIN